MWPALQIMQRVKWQFAYSTYLWSLGSRKSRTLLDLWTSSHSPCNVIQKALMVLIELFYNQLRLISWKIKFKINFEPKLTLQFMLLLSLLTLRTWSLLFKALRNGASEHAIKVWKCSWNQKVDFELSNFDNAASHRLKAYKGALYIWGENFTILDWKACSCKILYSVRQ